ncbi:MAG: hypothetical protein M3279_02015 [Actinomycetota bacterium]|nr:hypothetical protein [Actinomycetota bacterium]
MSRARVSIVLLVSLALLAPALRAQASAFPGTNGKIVYIAGDDVFTVDPDGTDVANLTQTPGLDAASVSASPDGKRIAFTVGSSVLDDAGLYVMNMNGTGFHDVLRGQHDKFIAVGTAAWSADGTQIAFEAYDYPGFKNELFVVDADGSDLRKLTNCDCVSSSYPVWSPAGQEIAFIPCCSSTITAINVQTRATREIVAPGGFVGDLTWSPDGTQLAFTHDLIDVSRVAATGGAVVSVTGAGPGYYENPSWSPDGTTILVESNHETQATSNNRDLYAIDAANGIAGGITRVTSMLDAESDPEWAPLCEGQCTPTSITFRVQKTRTAVKVSGQILPPVGGRANVALFRKTRSGYKRLSAKQAAFDAEGLFAATFNRPASGKCKVEARYAGDAEHEPTLTRKLFAC